MSRASNRFIELAVLGLLGVGGCSEYGFHDQALSGDLPPEETTENPGTPGDLDPPETTTPALDDDPDPCAADQVLTEVHHVDFPAVAGCSWDRLDNLSPVDLYMRAIGTQTAQFELGPGEMLCDLRVEFSTTEGGLNFPLQYDDQILFAFNERVVFTSDGALLTELETDASGLAIFSWLDLRDRPMSFDSQPWAVGTGYTVVLPGHDVPGDAVIAIEPNAISSLTSAADQASLIEMSLHAFGDNDPSDCGHTGMSFWLELDIGTGA